MKHIMSTPIIVGNIKDSICTVASLMKQYNIGFLPIAKENKIVGVITDRDLVIEALANNANPNTSVENYITHQIITAENSAKVEEVLQLMEQYQIKRILITENQKIMGVISFSDLLPHINEQTLIKTLKQIDQNTTHCNQRELEIDEFYL